MEQQQGHEPGLALVTGASSGIGRCIAIELARQGHSVAIDHYRDEPGAQRTLELVAEAGTPDATHFLLDADVGSADELDGLFQRIADDPLPFKVLVNNA